MLLDWCVRGLQGRGVEGIGVREMDSPESPGGLLPGRIGSTATEQGLRRTGGLGGALAMH
jgi:hypothetical protein